MTASSFDEALRRLLAHEGGYTNHPSDPGGPTNFGITIFDYRKYVKPGATAADVGAMRLDDAKAIYRSKYWNALRCDELPTGLDYAVFGAGWSWRVDRMLRDGVVIASIPHRRVRSPGDALDDQDARVVEVASAVWTQQVIAAWQAKRAADRRLGAGAECRGPLTVV